MTKFLVFLFLTFFAISSNIMAQGRLNRSVDAYWQRNQQRNVHRNYNQGTDQNQRRYSEEWNLREQQRHRSQQRIREQQSLKSEEDDNSFSLAKENNAGQNDSKTVTLVVDGTGQTIEEATQNALRSAIEQAFGTFVSANTEVLNDELVKDEIATVASGNISQYRILSTTKNENGLYDVSLQAVVSIGNLTNYAKSKGFQVELAGAEFVMNMKMRELNKKNELAAIEHLQKKLKSIASDGGLFSYELEKSEPILMADSKYGVKLKLLIYGNDNTKAFYDEIYNTLSALSLSASEMEEYKRVGLDYYVYDKQLVNNKEGEYTLRNNYQKMYQWIGREFRYYDNSKTEISWLMPALVAQALQFEIYDNLDNQFYCIKDTKYISKGCIWHYCDDIGNEVYYYLKPVDRISPIKNNFFMRQKRTGYSYSTQNIVIDIPLINYIKNPEISWLSLGFNPMEENYQFDRSQYSNNLLMERRRQNCYFQLEFFVNYSEDELYKLKNITVKHRDRGSESSRGAVIVQEEKSQKQTTNLTNDIINQIIAVH
jgi:hypothetical protein